MLTRARWPDPGRPLSRANAHVIRELVARHPMTPNMIAAMIKELLSHSALAVGYSPDHFRVDEKTEIEHLP